MKRLLYLVAITACCACNNKPEATQTVVIPTPTGIQGLQKSTMTAAVSQNKSDLIFNPPHGQPGHNCAIAVGAPLNQTAAAAQVNPNSVQPAVNTQQTVQVSPPVSASINAKGEKLNPAHGQPNHRCDIAVGAPLNSKPTQTAQVVNQPNAVVQIANPQKNSKLNPAHGQPNHRCDIAVGAPLNSKPAPVTQPVVVPATDNKVSLEAQNGQKLNPKHGEPGHRCDLAVGAPLT